MSVRSTRCWHHAAEACLPAGLPGHHGLHRSLADEAKVRQSGDRGPEEGQADQRGCQGEADSPRNPRVSLR